MRKIIIIIVAISFVSILVFLSLNKREGGILCKEVEDGYEIVLYNKWGNIIDATWSPAELGIHDITDELMEIVISVGSPARYIFYFDKKKGRVLV